MKKSIYYAIVSSLMISLTINGMFVFRQTRMPVSQARQRVAMQPQQQRAYGGRAGGLRRLWNSLFNSQQSANEQRPIKEYVSTPLVLRSRSERLAQQRSFIQMGLEETQDSIDAINSQNWTEAWLSKYEIEKRRNKLNILQKQKQQYREELNRLSE